MLSFAVRENQEKQALPTFLPQAQRNLKSCFLWKQVTLLTTSLCTVLNTGNTEHVHCTRPQVSFHSPKPLQGREVLLLFSFYKKDWGTERLNNLTKVTELVIGRAGIWTKVLSRSEPVLLCDCPQNIPCFWNLSLLSLFYLSKKSLFLPLLPATWQKSFLPLQMCLICKAFLKLQNWLGLLPPLNSRTGRVCLSGAVQPILCHKTSLVGWLGALALNETHLHLIPCWDTLNLQATQRLRFLIYKKGKMKWPSVSKPRANVGLLHSLKVKLSYETLHKPKWCKVKKQSLWTIFLMMYKINGNKAQMHANTVQSPGGLMLRSWV